MKHLTVNALVLLMTISFTHVFGQIDTSKHEIQNAPNGNYLIFSGGLSFQKQFFGELGIIYGKTIWTKEGPGIPILASGLKLATEFNFNSKNFILAPKVCFEFNTPLLGTRLSIIDFTNFTNHDFKFTPEIGISLGTLVNLFYGYNFSLTENRLDNIGTHRFTLTINYDRTFWKIINGKMTPN
ncbi:MAG: hypothetical protein U0V72_09235 [Cytophagales bacterium]